MEQRFSVADELLAISAIFGDAVSITDTAPVRVSLTLPWASRKEPVVATLTHVPGSLSWEADFEGFPRGTVPVVQKRISAVQAAAATDSPILYELLEEVRNAVSDISSQSDAPVGSIHENRLAEDRERTAPSAVQSPPVRFISCSEVVHMKSTFQAHIAQVFNREHVANVLQQLYADSRIARATHNMYAYRIVDSSGGTIVIADNDDDGEAAAGSRLAHLLDLMAANNLLVVVSRWFGGVLMGPSRFKAICEVAREAVENEARLAGWYSGRAVGTSAKAAGATASMSIRKPV